MADGSFTPLAQKNVDTGMGLERTICVLTGKKSVYETDAFAGILKKIGELCGKTYDPADEENVRAFRIVADHTRTATMIMGDRMGRLPLQRGPGLRPAPPDPPRGAHGHEARPAGGVPGGDRAGGHRPVPRGLPELAENSAFVLEQ